MAKKTTKDILNIATTGVVWGAGQSVVGSIPTTSVLGATTKNFAQSGMSIMYIKDISKKIKL